MVIKNDFITNIDLEILQKYNIENCTVKIINFTLILKQVVSVEIETGLNLLFRYFM